MPSNTTPKVRVRFAPSPTGEVHIGSGRTALFNYLFAKHHGGKLILRIEDTDQKRFVPGAVERLIEAMEWLGITFDEGVKLTQNSMSTGRQAKVKIQSYNSKLRTNLSKKIENWKLKIGNLSSSGAYGPYIQSQRLGIYQEFAQKLIEDGKAYYCFCSEARLKKMREGQIKNNQAPMYDQKCYKLPHGQIAKLLKEKKSYVIRLKINPSGKTNFTDLIRGYIEFDNANIDDQILIKSDGMPTYHLANVVDDHLMDITHVLRAEEWLPSTPKHVILYQAFDWEIPQFAHIPLVLASDKSKLSKRHGAVSIEEFRKLGYLPEALINYIALLGWNPKNDREFFSIEELIKEFNISKVNKAGAVFDIVKLDHFNMRYIKSLSDKDLNSKLKSQILKLPIQQVQGRQLKTKSLDKIITVIKERMVKLGDFEELARPFVKKIKYDPQLLVFKKSTLESTLKGLTLSAKRLSISESEDWESVNQLNQILLKVVSEEKLTNGDVFWSVRVALSGLEKSPSPAELLWVLDKEESLNRIVKAIKLLGSII